MSASKDSATELEESTKQVHPTVICVLPAFNEAGKIGRVVAKVQATGQVNAIVVVDDGSGDATFDEAAAAGAHVIRHQRNLGVGASIRTGLQYGREHGFAAAVILSGDDQHEPNELAPVLARLFEHRSHFIQGSRRIAGGKVVRAPLFREITTRVFSVCFSLLTGRKVTDGSNGFRAFYLSILDHPNINLFQDWLNSYELEPYLLYKALRSVDIRVIEMPITIYYHADKAQYSKMKPIRDWWRLIRPLFYLRLGLRS